jgi:hypothetical protein
VRYALADWASTISPCTVQTAHWASCGGVGARNQRIGARPPGSCVRTLPRLGGPLHQTSARLQEAAFGSRVVGGRKKKKKKKKT